MSTFEETLDKASFASAAGARLLCAALRSALTPMSTRTPPPDYAKETALHKAIEVAQRRFAGGELADLVIAADTVVDLGGEVLEKPDGVDGAVRMLTRLSGSRHTVHTGVALILPRAVGALRPRRVPCAALRRGRACACAARVCAAATPAPALRRLPDTQPSLRRRPGAGRVAAGG